MRKTTRWWMMPLLLVLCCGPVLAQSAQQMTVPLSEPGKPATLSVGLIYGSILVEGYDGKEITVDVRSEEYEEDDADESRDGLRRIPNTSLGLTIEERDNHVEVHSDWSNEIEGLHVMVPRNTSLQLSCTNCDIIQVEGVTGEHELNSTNGDITAHGISGSLLVNTTNGDVTVTMSRVDSGKAMSFVSFNGDVDITFPASLKADLRINTGHGDILTGFDVELAPQQPKIERDSDGKTHVMRLEKEVRAVIGGGGPEFRFKTFNGDIIIRKGS